MDGPVYQVKAAPKGLLQCAYAVKLCVMGPHDRAVVADQLLTGVAEVAQELVVQETLLLKHWIHLVG